MSDKRGQKGEYWNLSWKGRIEMNEEARKTMSVPEAGKHLGLGKNGAYAAAARGEIPVIKIGSRLRVPVVAFERMLADGGSDRAA
jgi:excisionase family DNA binding protein